MITREHYEIKSIISADYQRVSGAGMTYQHNHTHYEISVILSGRLEITNNDDRIETTAPCAVFHFPGTFHSVATDPSVVYERYNINYMAEIFRNYPSLLADTEKLFCSNVAVLPLGAEVLDELLYYIRPMLAAKSDCTKQTALLGVVLNILKSYVPPESFVSKDKPVGSYINGIVRYISDNLSPVMVIENIAAEFFVSRSKLAADFKRETGMTVKEYIGLLCVERAKLGLASGKSVQELSTELGYSNVGTFIRSFKKLSGITPGAYAKRF